MRRRPVRTLLLHLLLYALAAAPACLPLSLILRYGVDVPNKDEWDPDIAGVFIKAHQHQLWFHDLVQLHSEHRLLIPRLLLLPLYAVTHGNTIAAMLLGWLIACGTSLAVLWLVRQFTKPTQSAEDDLKPPTIPILWLLCNVLIFSLAQWENWLIGMGLVQLLVPLFIVLILGVDLSFLRPWSKVFVMIVLSAAVTYTSANGLLVWPLGMVLQLWPRRGSHPNTRFIVYTVAALLFVSLYFVGFGGRAHGASHSYASGSLDILTYCAAFLGAPFAFAFSGDPLIAAHVVGTVLLCIFAGAVAYFVFRCRARADERWCRQFLVALALGGFVVGSATLAGIGRGSLRPYQALSSRYISFSSYLPVSLVLIGWLILSDLQRRSPQRFAARWARRVSVALAALLIVDIAVEIPAALAVAKKTTTNRLLGKGALLLYRQLPQNPALDQYVFSDRATQNAYPATLNEMGYLHPPLITTDRAAAIKTKNPDAVGGVAGAMEKLAPGAPGQNTAAGWAIVRNRASPADAVFLTFEDAHGDSVIFAFAPFTTQRIDVNARFANDFGTCGWTCDFERKAVPQGARITAWALDTATATAYRLDGASVAASASSKEVR